MLNKFKLNSLFITFLILTIIFTPLYSVYADASYEWAKQIVGDVLVEGKAITTDTSGNVYTVGDFYSTTDFDPGAGIANLTSARGGDIFISKLDSDGNYVWAKRIGGVELDSSTSIILDSSNNIYVTGYFDDTVDFDPGAGTTNLTSNGNGDIFILKLDSSGNYVWVKKIGEVLVERANSLSIDSSGNMYLTGHFQTFPLGTVDFDPGAGTTNLTSAGNGDIFILKLDSSGNYVWVKSIGGISYEAGISVKTDSLGNVYTTGQFYGTTDFDPGAGTANLTSVGSADIFISKLDSDGNYVWAKSIGGG